MIFCGDFTFPLKYNKTIFSELEEEFLQKPKIVNFESCLDNLNEKVKTKGIALSSDKSTYLALNELNIKCTSHANNHSMDYSFSIDNYVKYFKSKGIETIGIGQNISKASKPFIYEPEQLLILSYGWETIRCIAASKNNSGVNPHRYKYIINEVEFYKERYPNYKIILYIHWNYEFETYPLPSDRQFAHYMIDQGVDGIFGHHPHIINGFEVYKNKPIFYSLGNFFFPQVTYGNHKLSFRENALEGISVDYNGNLDDLRIYHHHHDKKGNFLKLKAVYKINEFDKLNQLSSFSKLNHDSYIKFFIKNRFHKNKFLPVYKNYKQYFINRLYNIFVKYRQIPIDIITKIIKQ